MKMKKPLPKPPKEKKLPTPIPLSEHPTLTIAEFCAVIPMARSTFYKAVERGVIKPRRFGKRIFITQDELKRVVDNMAAY
jgi:hypothetical protein